MARPDVLLVSLGTTLGWRVADEMLLEQLRRAGASTAVVSVGRGAADRLRRGYPLNDIVEMHAARRTVRTAVERHEPRALILSTTTAAMLLPRLPVPYAVRFDSPARLNRPGARNAPLHALERRGMRGARITIPYSVAGAEALPADAARAIVVSPPIDASASHDSVERAERGRVAVAYVPDPKAKGLDVLVAGWAAAAVPDARLEVYGIEPEWARSHLQRSGVPEPSSLDLKGTVARRSVPRPAAPRTGLPGGRAVGGLGPGPTRSARGRRAARNRSLRRPVRGAAPGAPAGRVTGGRRDRCGRARSRDPRGVRDAGRPRKRLPRQSRRAAAPIPLGGSAGDGDPRAAARPARLIVSRGPRSQDGSLPRLRVGLRRVAVRDRLASGRQALA